MARPFNRVLIVSASVGAGHNRAATALAAELRSRYPGCDVRVADSMGGEDSYISALVKETYLKMIHLSPNIYDLLYRWSQAPRQFPKVQNLVARAMKRSVAQLYFRHRPDVIVFTHPFPCSAAAYLKRFHRIDAPLVAVVTDFAVHPLWFYDEVDLYFVASEDCRNGLIRLGAPAERICSTGIPIESGFSQPVDRQKTISGLGLDPARPVVLIMGGGLGLGPMADIVRTLGTSDSPPQMVVVAGKNAELRRQVQALAQIAPQRIVAFGYTKRVRELMAAAALLITKPGALTLSEALAAALPMVLVEPIPGQEEENARYLEEKGAAIFAAQSETITATVADLLADTARLADMRQAAGSLARPAAAATAVRLLDEYLTNRRTMAVGL